MAKPELISSISNLSKKIDSLLITQRQLLERIKNLETVNMELRKQHDEDQELLAKAQKDIDYLSLSHKLADSPEALVEARNKISKLIRTLDNCIRLINDD